MMSWPRSAIARISGRPTRRDFLRVSLEGGALAATAAGLSACTSAPRRPLSPEDAAPFAAPKLQVGERWSWQLINEFNRESAGRIEIRVRSLDPLVCDITRSGNIPQRIRGSQPEGMSTEARFSRPWDVLVDPFFDNRMEFDRPMPMMPERLQVGAGVQTEGRYRVRGASSEFRWWQTVQATAVDPVTTTAGTFRCLRIERLIQFQHPEFYRFNNARHDYLWYAPEVGAWVRRQTGGRYRTETMMDSMFALSEDFLRWELESHLSSPVS